MYLQVSADDEEGLIRRCLAGDSQAFEPLVERYHRPLFGVAVRMLGSRDEAQDVTQTVFLNTILKLRTYDPSYRFFSWVYRMTVNESLNTLKRRKRMVMLDDEPGLPAPGAGADRATEMQDRVGRALMQLKPDDRAVVVLRHFVDFSYEEIADVLEIPVKTVKSRLFTARERLRVTLRASVE